jgi:hypothetical protein
LSRWCSIIGVGVGVDGVIEQQHLVVEEHAPTPTHRSND